MKQSKISETLEQFQSAEIAKVMQVIEEKYTDPDLSVDSLSKEIGMSRYTLFRKLKRAFQLSPVELLRRYRLEKATNIMLKKQMSISDVAYEVGFNDSQYFSRCFKKEYNITPTAFIE